MEESAEDLEELADEVESIDADSESKEDKEKISEAAKEIAQTAFDGQTVGVATYLEGIEYDGGTLLDFFSRDYDEVNTDSGIRSLYPIVDALSPGQIAGLDFMSLMDLVSLAMTDKDTYKNMVESLESIKPISVYDGVDREIYEKGGVAMTSDTMRKQSAEASASVGYKPSTMSIVIYSITVGAAIACIGVKVIAKVLLKRGTLNYLASRGYPQELTEANINNYIKLHGNFATYYGTILTAGLAVLAVLGVICSIVTTVGDLKAYYRTDYLPIPGIMVEAKDITIDDGNGNPIMAKNQSAYYRVVRCNRTEGDSETEIDNYKAMEDKADLNGDIGRQWLALYTVKYEYGKPILADSFKVVKKSNSIPDGYKIGIHEFGTYNTELDLAPALDLNTPKYLFPDNPPSIKVYYKTEEKSKNELLATGSLFTPGAMAIGTGTGVILGALFMWLFMRRRRAQDNPGKE